MSLLLTQDLISTKEASLISGYNSDYLARLCRAGVIAGKRIGRTWCLERAALDAFMKAQEAHKQEIARTLSETRSREYRKARQEPKPMLLRDSPPERVVPVSRTFVPIRRNTPVHLRPSFAFALALWVIALSGYASVSDTFIGTARDAGRLAYGLAASRSVTYDGPATFLALRDTPATGASGLHIPDSGTLVGEIAQVAVSDIALPDAGAQDRASRDLATAAGSVGASRIAFVSSLLREPHASFAALRDAGIRAYVRTGAGLEGFAHAALARYASGVESTGKGSLALASYARDAAASAPARAEAIRVAYERGIYAWAEGTPRVARAVTENTLAFGNALGSRATVAPAVAGNASRDAVIAMVKSVAGTSSQPAGSAEPSGPAIASGRQLVAGVAAVPAAFVRTLEQSVFSAVRAADLALTGGMRLLAGLFSDLPRTLTSAPERIATILAPYASVPGSYSTTTSVSYGDRYFGDTTFVRNYYPQTFIGGVSRDEVDARFDAFDSLMRRNIASAVRNRSSGGGGSSSGGGNVSLNDPTFTGTATFDDATVNNDLSVGNDTSIGGNLDVGGDANITGTLTVGTFAVSNLSSNNAIIAPRFIGTSTGEASVFPNIIATTSVTDYATSTNLYATNFGVGGEYFTDLTGIGLVNTGGALSVSTTSLGAAGFYVNGGNAFGVPAVLGTTDAQPLSLITNNTTAATILTNGNVGIGTTSPFAKLSVGGDAYVGGNVTATGTATVQNLSIGSLSGFLKATAGTVATSLVSLASDITGTLPVGNGGTGSTSLTGLLVGNGASPVQTATVTAPLVLTGTTLSINQANSSTNGYLSSTDWNTFNNKVSSTSLSGGTGISYNPATGVITNTGVTSTSGDWTGTFDGQEGSYYLANSFSTTSANYWLSTKSTSDLVEGSNLYYTDGRVNTFIAASSTIPKTFAANLWTGTNTFAASGLTVTGLANGCAELVAGQFTSTGTNCGTGSGGITSLNGLVASSQTFATTSDPNIGLTVTSSGSVHTFTPTWTGVLAAGRGGTGLGSVTANELLIGNSSGTGWTQTATSSLGLPTFTDLGAYLTLAAWYATTTDGLDEGAANLYYTDARARAAFSFSGSGLSYNSGTGVLSVAGGYTIPLTASTTDWNTAYLNRITSATAPLSITSNTISITQANASQNGYLSATDWNTFNNKVSSTSLSGGTGISYNPATGVITNTGVTSSAGDWTGTFDGQEGSYYLANSFSTTSAAYFLSQNQGAAFSTTSASAFLNAIDKGYFFSTTSANYWLTTKSTTDLAEGSNLYYTDARVNSFVAGSTTMPKTYTTNTYTGGNIFANASSTNFNVSNAFTGAGLTSCSLSGDKLLYNSSTGQFTCGADAGAGGGITAIGAQYSSYQTGSIQTFATTSDTNIGLVITSSGNTHTFTPTWTGTLAVGRGGTGSSTLTGLLKGNGTGSILTAVPGTDYEVPLSFDSPLSRVGNTISLSTAGDWTGTFDGQEGSYYLANSFSTTSAAYFLSQNQSNAYSTTSADYWLTTKSTTNLAEGANLYYTDARARAALSSTATGLTYTSATGVFSLTGGYAIPLTASTTNWNSFFDVPSTRITDGIGLTWSGNTLNCDTASGSVQGCLTAADWTTFNNKQTALTFTYPLVNTANTVSLAFGTTTSNTWAGTQTFGNLVATNATTTSLGINSETFTDLTGTGLLNVGGTLTLDRTGDWAGTFDGQEGTYYLNRANHTGTQLASTISDFSEATDDRVAVLVQNGTGISWSYSDVGNTFTPTVTLAPFTTTNLAEGSNLYYTDARVNSYINASTTIPKTYTANTFTAPQTLTAGLTTNALTLDTLNGPLQANNGVVSATTSIGVLYGGTGLTSAPTYGQLLVGNSSGGYTLTATSSLGLVTAAVTSIGPTGQLQTGPAVTLASSTAGTDFTITASGNTITFNLPTASASNRGLLSSADWTTFNNKVSSTSLSGGTGISYNPATGVITNTGVTSTSGDWTGTFDGQEGSYYLANSFSTTSANYWLTTKSTTDLAEGSNLYYTLNRFAAALAGTTTDALDEGLVNLYYTDARVNSYINASTTIPKTYTGNAFTALQNFNAGASTTQLTTTGNAYLATTGGNVSVGGTAASEKLTVTGNILSSNLAGVGNRCVYADLNGVLRVAADNCGLASAGGDDLGNHIATQNIQLNNNWLSNDGGSEGISIDNSGNVTMSNDVSAASFTRGADTITDFTGSGLTVVGGALTVSTSSLANLNADLLDGLDSTYFLANSFSTTSANYWLTTKSTTDLAEGSNLYYTLNRFAAALAGTTTDALDEGVTNLYYTDARARAALSETITGIDYDNGTGVFSLTSGYTIPLTASTTNWNTFYDTPSSRITAGTNLSWAGNTLNGPSDTYIRSLFSANSPLSYDSGTGAFSLSTAGDWTGTFDGQEGSYYLANSFSTTSAAYFLSQNQGAAYSTTSANYWLTTKSTSDLAEGSNLYWTNARFDNRLSATTSLPNLTTLAGLTSIGTITTGVWNATDIDISDYTNLSVTYPLVLTNDTLSLAFGTTTSNTWAGTQTFNNLVATNATTTSFGINSETFTDLTGTGLQNVGGALTINATGDWTGTFDGQEGSYYLNRANHTGTQLASTISDFNTAVNSFVAASTTIPKTYTTNTFTALQTLTAGLTTNALTLGTLNGPLQANNGVVSATTSIGVLYGGTGLTSAPTYGQLLVGNASGGYTLTSTSSLGVITAAIQNIGPIGQFADGPNVTFATSTSSFNGLTNALTITGSGDTLTFTPSLSGTLNNAGLTNSTVSYGGVTLSLGGTDATPAFDLTDAVNLPIVGGTTGTLTVPRGGTGQTSFTAGNLVYGAGTGPLLSVATTTVSATGPLSFTANPIVIGASPITLSLGTVDISSNTNLATTYPVVLSNDTISLAFGTTTSNTWAGTQTFGNLVATNATTTSLGLNNETFTDLTGSGLLNVGGTLTLDRTGDWTGTFDGQEGTYYLNRANHTGTQLASTISDFSSTARGLFSGIYPIQYNSGTGAFSLAFGTTTSNSWAGTQTFTNILTTNATTTSLGINAETFTDLTGTGLSNVGGVLTVSTSSLANLNADLLDGLDSTYFLANSFSTTSADYWKTQNNFYSTTSADYWLTTKSTTNLAEGSNLYYTDARVNSYINASTTIPKTYTSNVFTNSNSFNGTFTLGTLNGPLQANNGVVSATTSIGVLYGGTGLTSAPTYGQLLVGNASGGYTLTATTSLGLITQAVQSIGPAGQLQTGPAVTLATTTSTTNGVTSAITILGAGNTLTFTPSQSGTLMVGGGGTGASSFSYGLVLSPGGTGALTNIATSSLGLLTTNVAEGSNLYYTDERVDDRVAVLIQNGTGISWSYSDVGNTFTPTVTLAPFTTTNLAEGSNLYYTDARVNSYIAASTTIPKTYTANTFSALQSFNGGITTNALTLGSLNGPLQANNGVVSATTSIGVLYGGTGLTSAPTYGQLLVGNSSGGYTLTATSSLGLITQAVQNIGPTGQMADGPNVTLATSTSAFNGLTQGITISGSGDTLTFTPSLSGTLNNAGLTNSTVSYGGVTLSLGGTDATPAFDLTDAFNLPIVGGTTGTLTVARGGTGATSLTDNRVLTGNGTGAIVDEANLTFDGSLLTVTGNASTSQLTATGSAYFATAGGNVGIGTAAPSARLDVAATYSTTGYPLRITNSGYYNAYFQGTDANDQASFYMENDRGSFASYGGFLYGGSTSNLSNIFGVSRADRLFMFADGASNLGMYVGTLAAQPFVIGTNNTERLRVDGTGRVGIGTTTPGALFSVQGNGLFSGNLSLANLTATGTITTLNLTATNATTTSFGINSETFTDLTGTGLQNVGGALTINATGDWTGTFDGQEGTYYLNRANHTGTQLASTISDFNTAVNSFVAASTTIPKTYTTNTFTALQTFTAGVTTNALTLGTLNGPLQANNGVVSATTSIGVLYGGTGLTSAPTYGQLLVGNASGGYTLTATSSLGLVTAAVTSIGPAGQLQTGPAVTLASSTTGTDFTVTASGNTITFNLPTASASNRGLLSSTDWSTFNSKENALTFTYPIQRSTNTVSLAFGTTTSNTWAGTQTFTNSPIFSTLGAGTVNSTSGGTLYATGTSTPSLASELSYSGTLGQFIGGASGTLSLTNNGVALSKLAQIGANTILGNPTGSTGNVQAFATSSLGIAISDTTGTLTVPRGGTGQTSFTAGNLIYGAGSGALQSVATTTLSGNSQIALSQPISVIGASPSVLSITADSIGDTQLTFNTGQNLTTASSPTFAGALFTASTTVNGNATTTGMQGVGSLFINNELFTDLTGTGLTNVGGALTVSTSSLANLNADLLDGLDSTYFLANSFSTTSANYWETTQTPRTADDLTNNSIEDLSDVAAMTKNFGDLLYWNGSTWTDIATSSLGINGSIGGTGSAGQVTYWSGGSTLAGSPAFTFDGTDLTLGSGSQYLTTDTAGAPGYSWTGDTTTGMYHAGASTIGFSTGGNERVRIDGNGFLGIGTTSPSAELSVEGSALINGDLVVAGNLAFPALTGILASNGSSGVSARTLTAPAAGLTISNANGAAGNPTFALANDLAALEGLSGTGIAVRTGTDTWAQRTVTGNSQITVTDGNGVAGNPTLSITADSIGDAQLAFNTGQNLTTVSSPTFAGLTVDTLNGPLQANNGVVSATTSIGVLYGGTGLTSAPTYGQLLVGNASGGYTLTATSSLGLVTAAVTNIGPAGQTADGPTVTFATTTSSFNGLTTGLTITGSGDTLTFTPSLSGTLNNAGLTNSTVSYGGVTLSLGGSDATPAFDLTDAVNLPIVGGTTGTLTVARGGTGATSFTSGNLIYGAGSGALQSVATTTVAATGPLSFTANPVVIGSSPITLSLGTVDISSNTNLAATYPILLTGDTLSLAFGTTTSNTWAGTQTFNNLVATNATTTSFGLNSETFTDLTGTGLQNVGGALTINATGDWTGTFDGQEGTYYLNRANHTGTQLASTISDFNTAVNSFVAGSTTIPKTYTANTWGALQTFTSGITTNALTLGTLNGPLQANNGVVSATTSIGVLYGGTGLTSAPTYGQLLVGNSSGGYTLTATSSLGLVTAAVTSIGPAGQLQTGPAVTLASSTTGTDFTITGTGNGITFNLPTASAANRGLLSSADWTTFNNKQGALTFTYPLVNTANTVSLAFGTTTSNTWTGTQTFTNSPVFSTLGAGTVNSTSGGTLYSTGTSTPTLASELAYSGTLGQFIGGSSGTLSLSTNGTALSKLVQIGANTILGNPTGSTGNVQAFATSSLGIAISDTTGTLTVARGGTGQTTFSAGQLLYGNGTNGLSSVATSSVTCTTGASCTSFTVVGSGSTITTTLGTSVDLASEVTGTLPVANGGTGSTTLTGLLKGNGTGSVQTAVAGTDYQAPGNYITALTGDVTASGPGSAAATLATVNGNVGSFGGSTAIPTFTVNGKGLITAAGSVAVIAPAGTLTGTTLAANVVTSSLTSVGTLTALTVSGNTSLTNASTTNFSANTLAVGGTGTTTISSTGALSTPSLTVGSLSGLLYGNSGAVAAASVSSPLLFSAGTLSIGNAAADGSTKGAATFTAADFDASSGVISLDYANGQKASGSLPGFLSSADWTTFNNKVSTTRAINTTYPLQGGGDLSADRTLTLAFGTTTANTWGALQTFTSGITTNALTLGTLNGPLQANNGVVSATTSIGVLYGGTGLTSAPTYGQLLVGNASGGYTLTATSSLGLVTAAVTNIGPAGQTADGPTVTFATSTTAFNGLTPNLVITGSGDTLTFASSLSGTLNNAGLTNSTVSYGGVTLSLGGTDATPAFDLTDAVNLPIVGGTTGTLTVARGGTGATTFTGGLLVGNGTSALISRVLTGTTNRLTVTNGDGIAGNPTFDISSSYVGQTSITTLGTITTGTWTGTAIAAANGGTGQTSYAVGDILYASGTTALSKLADVATGNVLISGGTNTAPSWGKVGLTTHVNGTLPVTSGGTGATTLTGMLKGNGTSAFTAVTGTDNYFPKWSSNSLTSTSLLYATGVEVRIGTTTNYAGNPSRLFVWGGGSGANIDVMGDPSVAGGDQATIELESSSFPTTVKSVYLQYVNHGIGTSLGFANTEVGKLVFGGDTNLIYTPGVKPLIFGTDSTERLRISEDGNFGIGTTTPGTLLSLGNTGANTINISPTATSTFGSGINIRTGCFAVNGTCLSTGGGSGTVTSVDASGGTTGLTFSGGPVTTSGTLTLAGTLGVPNGGTGATTFTAGNLVYGAGTGALQSVATTTLSGNSQIALSQPISVIGASPSVLSITNDSIGDTQLTFNTGQNLTTASSPTFAGLTLTPLTSALLVTDGSGVLAEYAGTGCTNQVIEDISALGAANCVSISDAYWSGTDLSVANGGTGASTLTGLLQGNGTSAITGVTGTAGQFPYYNGTNTLLATSTLFLATNGNVGIGTTTPADKLTVQGLGISLYGTDAALRARLQATEGGVASLTLVSPEGYEATLETGDGYMQLDGALAIRNDDEGAGNPAILVQGSSGQTASLIKVTSGPLATPLFDILPSGNVGIGTTSPYAKLSVVGQTVSQYFTATSTTVASTFPELATSHLSIATGGTIDSLGALTVQSNTSNALTLDSGTTGTVNLGTNANAKTINIGTGAAVANNLNIGGTGANVVRIGDTQASGSISLGAAMVGGTISIGGGSQTGAITVGNTTGAQTLNLGIGGTGIKTLNIGNGTSANVIAIGGTGANTITLGDTQSTGSISLGAAMVGGTISIGGTAQTGTVTLAGGTGSQIVNIGTGATGAKTVNIGTGASVANNLNIGGTGANVIALGNTQTGGSISLGAAMTGGTITLGGAVAQTGTIIVGQSTAANTVRIGDGTGATIIQIGTGVTNAKTISIGTGAAMANNINIGGTGANVIALGNTQTGGSISIGTAMTSGTVTIGGAIAQAGAITIGQSTATNNLNLGIGTGATTVNIGTGITNAKTINIGNGASVANVIAIGGTGANTITLGDTQTAGSISLGAAMTGGTISIGGTGAQTGTISIGPGTGAQILNFGTGGTGAKTINIGTGAVANPITIGNTTTGTTITLNGGIAASAVVNNTAATARLLYTGSTDTALTASTEAPDVYFNLGQARTHAIGAITLQRDFRITGSTHAAAGSSVITDAAALSIDGPPVAGTNVTITNTHGLYIPALSLAGAGTETNSYGLTVNAATGATNNYAAAFLGGNVGIGSTSPAVKLDVNGAIQANVNSTSIVGFAFSDSPTSGIGYVGSPGNGNTAIFSEGDLSLVLTGSLGNFRVPSDYEFSWSSATNNLSGSDAGLSRLSAGVVGVGNGTVGASAGTLIAGKIGVATTTPWRTLSVTGTVAFDGLTSSATGNAVCITATKDITNAGAATCTPSSIRFKENVETLSHGTALDILNRLRVVSFDYKNGYYSPEESPSSYGLIAEEVERIDPKLVDYGYDGKVLTLHFEKLTGLSIQAVQELSLRADALSLATSTLALRLTDIEETIAGQSTGNPQQLTASSVSAQSVTASGDMKAARFIAPLSGAALPNEVLSAGGVDLYKLATYALADASNISGRVDALAIHIEDLETRLAALEAASSSWSILPEASFTSMLASAMNGWGAAVEDGMAYFKNIKIGSLFIAKGDDGTSAAGAGSILEGNTVVEVVNPLARPNSKIFITFTSPVEGSWYLSDKEEGSFRVRLSQAQSGDVTFDYFIVQTEGDDETEQPVQEGQEQPPEPEPQPTPTPEPTPEPEPTPDPVPDPTPPPEPEPQPTPTPEPEPEPQPEPDPEPEPAPEPPPAP